MQKKRLRIPRISHIKPAVGWTRARVRLKKNIEVIKIVFRPNEFLLLPALHIAGDVTSRRDTHF
jgi:hypothetical protein